MNNKLTKRKSRTLRTLRTLRFQRRMKRFYAMLSGAAMAAILTMVPALATGGTGGGAATNDALTAVSNLSTFIFSLIRAVGLILLGYGILQVGLSFQSHDPSQRSNGILTIAGGIIIVFTKEILDLITG
mgnify:CR=1 FL=1